MTNQIEPEPIQIKKTNKWLLAFLIFLVLCAVTCLILLIIRQRNSGVIQAQQLALQGRCPEAIQILNEVIAENPKSVIAYQIRVECYLSFQSNVYTESQGYLIAALEDTNIILGLKPQDASYYGKRDFILRELAPYEIYSANKYAIFDLANQDAQSAIELGAPSSAYVYRHYARNFIEANHCQEGLEETQKLIQQYGTQTSDYGQYYSLYLTEAYICLGELDLALESAQAITCDDPVSTCKSGLLAEIYLQSGDYENALNTVNYMINWQPAGGGWRYFIRALIYYEQGQIDLAQQDLATGDAYSWYGTGVDEYVLAQLAFDNGDKVNGIYHLQTAEQMFDTNYSVLRQETLKQLKKYGAEPIPQKINLPFSTPSLP
ncbi:MAG TPA: hypothetical protein PLL95_12450 [Anaerolineales bacterium]|nr:hypothetical protein [Anaerolineales bacterium]